MIKKKRKMEKIETISSFLSPIYMISDEDFHDFMIKYDKI